MRCRAGLRERPLLEHLLPRALGAEGAAIEQRPHLRLRPGSGKHVELLLRALVIAREAEQLEQEGAAPSIGGVVPQLDTQRLDRFLELAGLE